MFKDSRTGAKGSRDLLLQPASGHIVYRMVQNYPAIEDDFFSHHQAGVVPNPTISYSAFSWLGVSVFLDVDRAYRLVQTRHKRGDPAWLARLNLSNRGGRLYGVYTEKTTHLGLFGLPKDLLDCVDNYID